MDPMREKRMVLLKQGQFFFSKHDLAVKFGPREKPAITSQNMKAEKENGDKAFSVADKEKLLNALKESTEMHLKALMENN